MNFAFIRRLRPFRLSRSPSDRRKYLGRRGERAAARYLKRQNHALVTRNYRCAVGELDLVTVDRDTIVFVEVKTRSTDEAQLLHEAVRTTQWGRIERAAAHFIRQRRAERRPCRFDLVTVLWSTGKPIIEHFVDAHQARLH